MCKKKKRKRLMLLSLAQWLQTLSPDLGFLRVCQYLTLRAVMAALTALLIGLLAGPFVIRRLIALKIGQPIREYAMQTHLSKSGTPTMGGVLILMAIGISTLLFWNQFSVSSGLHLSVLGQVSYIASFVMLLVLARLQSFDQGLEEAALDLGASHAQVMRRILLPHLYPALGAGAAIAFFQSIENFNVTLFTRGNADTLTVYVFSKVRSGITPTINALALLLILFTLGFAIWFELNRRRRAKVESAREAEGRRAADAELA